MNRSIEILRLDHRIFRDQRITSHVGLTARALGAKAFSYSGEKDENLEKSLLDVATRWGGKYTVNYVQTPLSHLKKWKGVIVHLTMYGEPHLKTIEALMKHPGDDLLIIVGGAKVPRFIYSNVDFNTSIGWQPHSEVSAVGIFLYALNGSEMLYVKYDDAEISIDGSSAKSKRSERFNNI